MDHEHIIRQALRTSTTPQAAERAILAGLRDVVVSALAFVMTDEVRHAVVIGRQVGGSAFRTTTSVPAFAWIAR